MKLIVKFDGETYTGKETPGTQDEYNSALGQLVQMISSASYFQLELEDGRTLVLPSEAARRAVLLFAP